MKACSPAGRPVRLDPSRILVVEDEALVALLVEYELNAAGATVVGPAASVAIALRLLDQSLDGERLDAAVLDVNLGGESVLPVADRLAVRGVPFIFVTGYGDAEGLGRHAGVPILRKPFAPPELVATLACLIRARTLKA